MFKWILNILERLNRSFVLSNGQAVGPFQNFETDYFKLIGDLLFFKPNKFLDSNANLKKGWKVSVIEPCFYDFSNCVAIWKFDITVKNKQEIDSSTSLPHLTFLKLNYGNHLANPIYSDLLQLRRIFEYRNEYQQSKNKGN